MEESALESETNKQTKTKQKTDKQTKNPHRTVKICLEFICKNQQQQQNKTNKQKTRIFCRRVLSYLRCHETSTQVCFITVLIVFTQVIVYRPQMLICRRFALCVFSLCLQYKEKQDSTRRKGS